MKRELGIWLLVLVAAYLGLSYVFLDGHPLYFSAPQSPSVEVSTSRGINISDELGLTIESTLPDSIAVSAWIDKAVAKRMFGLGGINLGSVEDPDQCRINIANSASVSKLLIRINEENQLYAFLLQSFSTPKSAGQATVHVYLNKGYCATESLGSVTLHWNPE